MSRTSSRLHFVIEQAYRDLRDRRSQLRIVRVGGSVVLVVGSRLGGRATVNGRPLLQCQEWALHDSVGAPLIIQTAHAHLGIFVPYDRMLIRIGSGEFFVVVKDKLRVIDREVYQWLLGLRQAHEAPVVDAMPDAVFQDLLEDV